MNKKISKKQIGVSNKYSIYNHIINLISVAKQCKIDTISVPLWDREFPFVPSLYCVDLKNANEAIKDLKQYMNINIKKSCLYYNGEIDGIKQNDISRYIEVSILEISNISKIRYFGVCKDKSDNLSDLLQFSTTLIEREVKNKSNAKGNEFSIFELNLDFMSKFERKNSYYSFLFALNNIKKNGFIVNINTNMYTDFIHNNYFFFKKKVCKFVTIYSITLKTQINKLNL